MTPAGLHLAWLEFSHSLQAFLWVTNTFCCPMWFLTKSFPWIQTLCKAWFRGNPENYGTSWIRYMHSIVLRKFLSATAKAKCLLKVSLSLHFSNLREPILPCQNIHDTPQRRDSKNLKSLSRMSSSMLLVMVFWSIPTTLACGEFQSHTMQKKLMQF